MFFIPRDESDSKTPLFEYISEELELSSSPTESYEKDSLEKVRMIVRMIHVDKHSWINEYLISLPFM